MSATIEDFEKLDVRLGEIVEVSLFPEGKRSTHVLIVDFGPEIGRKKSVARLAANYEGPELVGRQVVCVVNFPPRQIGKHRSECLTLGVPDEGGEAVLLSPHKIVPPGGRLY